jgi:hypothetical protein
MPATERAVTKETQRLTAVTSGEALGPSLRLRFQRFCGRATQVLALIDTHHSRLNRLHRIDRDPKTPREPVADFKFLELLRPILGKNAESSARMRVAARLESPELPAAEVLRQALDRQAFVPLAPCTSRKDVLPARPTRVRELPVNTRLRGPDAVARTPACPPGCRLAVPERLPERAEGALARRQSAQRVMEQRYIRWRGTRGLEMIPLEQQRLDSDTTVFRKGRYGTEP